MSDSLTVSAVQAGFARLDVVANNVANLVTPGFKPTRTDQVALRAGGVQAGGRVLFSQGPPQTAEEGFALAIQGDGFFQVETSRGARFTRGGDFQVDAFGTLVTGEGFPILPSIQIPAQAVSILVTRGGQVLALFNDGSFEQVGQVALSVFANPGGLIQEGRTLFAPSAASGPPQPGSTADILFGSLEGSSTDLAGQSVDSVFLEAAVRANLAAHKVEEETTGALLDILG